MGYYLQAVGYPIKDFAKTLPAIAFIVCEIGIKKK
jgi:hypothetical protein